MTRPIPDHGTISRYKYHGCKCLTCMDAWRDYTRNVRRQTAYGRWQPLTDAEPIRAHVRTLMASGIGIRRIAELADISQSALSRLLYGKPGKPPTQKMHRTTADKILAIHPTREAYADGAAIDSTGTRRRLQALLAVGWPRAAIARHMGMPSTQVSYLMRHPRVTVRIARQVAAVYDRLWDANPADHGVTDQAMRRARNEASRNGWASPLAWEDDLIDDPKARPCRTGCGMDGTAVDQAAVMRALEGERIDLTPRERTAAIELGMRRGWSMPDLAAELGMELGAVQRSWERIKARRRAQAKSAEAGEAAGEVA